MEQEICVSLYPSASLARTLSEKPDISIEAEYGSLVVEGRLYTAAHHQADGPYCCKVSPAPCNNTGIPILASGGVVMLSHLDLDSVGGALRTFPEFADLFDNRNADFWVLAEFVDLNGPHRLDESLASEATKDLLYAYWAWSQENRGPPLTERDEKGKVVPMVRNVTDHIRATGEMLRALLIDSSSALLEAGNTFRSQQEKLNETSFVESVDGVSIRVSDAFVNAFYNSPDSETIADAVVGFNTKSGAVTVSLAVPIEGISCREIVQQVFLDRGPTGELEAGGRDVIAGSPRGRRCTFEEFSKVIDLTRKMLREGPPKAGV